ncbi:MAG: LEPR-XLL domain-containing protein, partial [Verrucomicrobiota bacterium]
MKQTETSHAKQWFFARTRYRAYREWFEKIRKNQHRSLQADSLEPRVLFSGTPVPVTNVDLDQPGPGAQEIVGGPATGTSLTPVSPTDSALSSDPDVLAAQMAGNNLSQDPLQDPNNSDDTHLPNEEMIGEHFQFGVSFENSGNSGNIGYAPYMDLVIPSGINMDSDGDGQITASTEIGGASLPVQPVAKLLEFDFSDPAIAALFAGADSSWAALGVDGTPTGTTRIWVDYNHPAVNGEEFALTTGFGGTAPVAGGADYRDTGPNGNTIGTTGHTGVHFVEHPILKSLGVGADNPGLDQISAYNPAFNDGDVLYTVQFPFGSYSPNQPAVEMVFEGMLDPDFGSTIDQTMFIRSMGGFALGSDPLNNPGVPGSVIDPPVGGVNSLDDVTLRGANNYYGLTSSNG